MVGVVAKVPLPRNKKPDPVSGTSPPCSFPGGKTRPAKHRKPERSNAAEPEQAGHRRRRCCLDLLLLLRPRNACILGAGASGQGVGKGVGAPGTGADWPVNTGGVCLYNDAVEIYRTEQEQLDALKRWWVENGRAIFAGVVCSLLGIFSWQSWQERKGAQSLAASTAYLRMLETEALGRPLEQRIEQARGILRDYGRTAYAGFAALRLASWAVQEQDLEQAAGHLRWVLEQGGQKQLHDISRLRLARVYIAEARLDEARQLLAVQDPGGFAPLYAELRGDIHALRGEQDAARKAWQEALLGYEEEEPLLSAKLEDLGP